MRAARFAHKSNLRWTGKLPFLPIFAVFATLLLLPAWLVIQFYLS